MTEPCDEPVDDPRVMVFIDGQNLFKGLHRRSKTRLHPLVLEPGRRASTWRFLDQFGQ